MVRSLIVTTVVFAGCASATAPAFDSCILRAAYDEMKMSPARIVSTPVAPSMQSEEIYVPSLDRDEMQTLKRTNAKPSDLSKALASAGVPSVTLSDVPRERYFPYAFSRPACAAITLSCIGVVSVHQNLPWHRTDGTAVWWTMVT